ncbi:hypothetical protein HDU99_000634 [Rhizoclosmatium hyalinum]|nr:hypothetical protein HDU99_000634 [Rhizoclosmatium hyalinum]
MAATYITTVYYFDSVCSGKEVARIEYVVGACSTASPRTGCTATPGNSAFHQTSGCVAAPNLASFGDAFWDGGASVPRVQFTTFADAACAAPTRVSEFLLSIDDCVDNAANLLINDSVGNAIQYKTERFTIDPTSNAIYRTYFNDDSCVRIARSISFVQQGTQGCSQSQSVQLINYFGFMSTVLFATANRNCQDPSTSVQYRISNEPCLANSGSCDTGRNLNSLNSCPTTFNFLTSAQAHFGSTQYIAMRYFLDSGCTIPYWAEALAVNFCQPRVFGGADHSVKLASDGGSFSLIRYSDSSCTKQTSITVVSTDGSCSNGIIGLLNGQGSTAQPVGTSQASSPVQQPTGVFTTSDTNLIGASGASTTRKLGQSNNPTASGTAASSIVTDSPSSSIPMIAGIAGGVVFIALLAIGFFVFRSRRNKYEQFDDPVSTHQSPTPSQYPQNSSATRTLHSSNSPPVELRSLATVNSATVSSTESFTVLDQSKALRTEKQNPLFKAINEVPIKRQPRDSSNNATSLNQTSSTSPNRLSYFKSVDLQNGLTLPTDPSTWSVEEVAQWVSQNGGTAAPILEQDIDGRALMALATDDLFVLLHIATVGKRVQFSQAMESLHAPPPSYVDN